MTRWRWMIVLAGLAFAGCASRAAVASSSTAVTQPAVEGDPTDNGRRRAALGARCDYGGAADLTCHRGTYCCYGPPDDPGTFGECMVECPAY